MTDPNPYRTFTINGSTNKGPRNDVASKTKMEAIAKYREIERMKEDFDPLFDGEDDEHGND